MVFSAEQVARICQRAKADGYSELTIESLEKALADLEKKKNRAQDRAKKDKFAAECDLLNAYLTELRTGRDNKSLIKDLKKAEIRVLNYAYRLTEDRTPEVLAKEIKNSKVTVLRFLFTEQDLVQLFGGKAKASAKNRISTEYLIKITGLLDDTATGTGVSMDESNELLNAKLADTPEAFASPDELLSRLDEISKNNTQERKYGNATDDDEALRYWQELTQEAKESYGNNWDLIKYLILYPEIVLCMERTLPQDGSTAELDKAECDSLCNDIITVTGLDKAEAMNVFRDLCSKTGITIPEALHLEPVPKMAEEEVLEIQLEVNSFRSDIKEMLNNTPCSLDDAKERLDEFREFCDAHNNIGSSIYAALYKEYNKKADEYFAQIEEINKTVDTIYKTGSAINKKAADLNALLEYSDEYHMKAAYILRTDYISMSEKYNNRINRLELLVNKTSGRFTTSELSDLISETTDFRYIDGIDEQKHALISTSKLITDKGEWNAAVRKERALAIIATVISLIGAVASLLII